MLIRDCQWYEALLTDLHAAVHDLDVSGYRWAPSDGWRRERMPSPTRLPTAHLEAWIDLGNTIRDGSQIVHPSRLIYAVRYQPDDDGRSQGILHASIADLTDLLTTWTRSDGVRTSFTSSTIEIASTDWLLVTVAFSTRYPWRA